MSDPTPSRRFALLLVLTFGILIANCSQKDMKKKRLGLVPFKETFCEKGNGSPSRPLICVDEASATLIESPKSPVVFDVEADPGAKRSNRPVVIHWFTKRTASLGIEFTDKTCVDKVECDGSGHCWARVKKFENVPIYHDVKDVKPLTQCTYSLNLNGKAVDPPIVINPCCWVTEPIFDQLDAGTGSRN